MSGVRAVLLGLVALSVAAGPVTPPKESSAVEWTKTYILWAEESEAKGELASRRIEIESPASEVWMVEEASMVDSWDWECNCYLRIPSAEVVSARMERDEERKVVAVVLSIRPATVCSPTSPACWRAPWQVTVTLSGKTKAGVGGP